MVDVYVGFGLWCSDFCLGRPLNKYCVDTAAFKWDYLYALSNVIVMSLNFKLMWDSDVYCLIFDLAGA